MAGSETPPTLLDQFDKLGQKKHWGHSRGRHSLAKASDEMGGQVDLATAVIVAWPVDFPRCLHDRLRGFGVPVFMLDSY